MALVARFEKDIYLTMQVMSQYLTEAMNSAASSSVCKLKHSDEVIY